MDQCPGRMVKDLFPDFPTPLDVSLVTVLFTGYAIMWLMLPSCIESPGTAEPNGEGLGTNRLEEARPVRMKNVITFVVMSAPVGDLDKGQWPLFQHQECPVSG